MLELIQEEGSAKVAVLKHLFAVSEPTIRQDLAKLEEDGFVIRRHGGAFLKTIPRQVGALSLQHSVNMGLKEKLGRRALDFIADGESIILDAGTTTTEIAKHLQYRDNLNVITSAVNISLLLGSGFNTHVILTGGEFKPPTLSLTGGQAAKFFDNTVMASKLFLAVTGISEEGILTYPGLSDIAVKQAMISAAQEVFLVADSSKMGKVAFAALGSVELVDHIITDAGLPERFRSLFEGLGVDVIIAE